MFYHYKEAFLKGPSTKKKSSVRQLLVKTSDPVLGKGTFLYLGLCTEKVKQLMVTVHKLRCLRIERKTCYFLMNYSVKKKKKNVTGVNLRHFRLCIVTGIDLLLWPELE